MYKTDFAFETNLCYVFCQIAAQSLTYIAEGIIEENLFTFFVDSKIWI